MRHRALISVLLFVSGLRGAGPSCPAGMPLGNLQIAVRRTETSVPIPLSRINRIEEGDTILYSPSLKAREKRNGEVAVVLVAARPSAGEQQSFAVLQPKDAGKKAEWKAAFQASLAIYVYGPAGLSTRKLKGFLANDQELVAQLADYAEKTAQTETALQAIASYEVTGRPDNIQSALQGFAGQYGNTAKIDRSVSADQQTLAAMQRLNPALSAYDPIAPVTSRVSQTTGLAATVAGMFFGSTVGLAAGGTAMALNLKMVMFPDTDFRSAYTQAATADTVTLCSSREATQSRKRLAYLWAMRIPPSGPPHITLDSANHIPLGQKTQVRIDVPKPDWYLVSRIRDWRLTGEDGNATPIPVHTLADTRALEFNLTDVKLPPGRYSLSGFWDWDPYQPNAELFVHPLSDFLNVHLSPESQNRLQEQSGKQIVNLEGDDFEFVDKVAMMPKGDKYSSPAPVPFSLPLGPRKGVQKTLEMQIDTTSLHAGDYTLFLSQQGGRSKAADLKILSAPPKLEKLPILLNSGEPDSSVVLEGEGLESITGLAADGLQFELEPPVAASPQRTARVRQIGDLKEGSNLNLRLSVRNYAQPLFLPDAIRVAGRKPRIRAAEPSLPPDLPVTLRQGEIPAGFYISVMLRADGANQESKLRLSCRNMQADEVTVRSGSEEDRIKLQGVQSGSLFLSFDPGRWPSGCSLQAAIENADTGRSQAFELGKVVRIPNIETFKLSDTAVTEGIYAGTLTGRDLELIEKTGWDAEHPQPVSGLPIPIVGEGNKQSLKIQMPWPSPTPQAPLYVWFRGESAGRVTTVKY